ncbi:MAG: VanZ family protein [Kiritimatiellae bacterium]|nr:VanZ family protein [Kiritimatiellia bacterium]MCO5069044.1 VanZ family protein [Kiritimatiellia bacterium]
MFQAPPREKEWISWLFAALWGVLIFCTIPFARAVQGWFAGHWGAGSLRWISIGIIGATTLFVIARLLRELKTLSRYRIAVILGIAATFIYFSLELMETPSEAVHFIEYGILGLLLFRALAHRQRDPLIFLNVVLIGALVSTSDEILQWLTPGRYWDIRDLQHNALAVGLVQLGLAVGFAPPFIQSRIRRGSARCAAILIAVQAVLLGLCATNTPSASLRAAMRFPSLCFLLNNDNAMIEYGWRHEDPDQLRFYSRFSRADLARLDRTRGAEVGAILATYAQEPSLRSFLRYYTPVRDPFTHEAMIHLSQRNHYFAVLPKYRFETNAYRFHANVAVRENQILDRYFSNSLAHAQQVWTPELKEALAPQAFLDRRFTSEVSRHLFHRIWMRGIWLIVLAALFFDLLFYLQWGAEGRAGPPREGELPMDAPRDWVPVLLWMALIYCAIPLARRIQYFVTEYASRDAFEWAVYLAIAVGSVATVLAYRARSRALGLRQWGALGALVGAFAWGAWHLRANPEEALHLVEYGVLSLLLYRAFSRRYRDRGAYVVSFLLGALLGIVDEVIQWVTPARFFDFRDVAINVLAVLAIQVGLAAGLAPQLWSRPFQVRSARTAWRQIRLILLLLFACLSNTPEFWRPLYSYRPDVFVFKKTMVEYGHRHRDPDVGSFKSRMTREQLRFNDDRRAGEIASIMQRRGSDGNYDAFLQRYTAASDPFAMEFRVRLFRRDRNWRDARANRADPALFRKYATIAFGEQRLLENWFGNSLRAAERDVTPEVRAQMAAAAAPGVYDSPVSRELITRFTRREAQGVVGALILVVVAVGRYDVARRKRRERKGLP